MVLGCPVPSELMRSTPLFSFGPGAGAAARPLRHHCMDAVLKALLRTFLDESSAQRYSWHSFRVGLACSLLAAGASEAVILALCRWRSPASLRIYARLNSSTSAAWLDLAGLQQLNSVQAPSLPQLSLERTGPDSVPGALLQHVYDMLDRIEAEPGGPTAAELRELTPPEIDNDRWVGEMEAFSFANQDEVADDIDARLD
jgi:hypothetical protein